MRNELAEYLVGAKYPATARIDLLACYDALKAAPEGKPFFGHVEAYGRCKDMDYDAARDSLRQVAEALKLSHYTVELLFYLCLIPNCRRYYGEAGLPASLMDVTLLDLRYKLEECRLVYGITGIFVGSWFDRFFKLERFAFGRLQFELVPFAHTYHKGDIHLGEEDTVINVHVPRTGEPLDRAACREGYRRAASFFAGRVKRPVFTCCSWLLYPATSEMLAPEANIRRYAADYEIIEKRDDFAHSDMWRLFDCAYTGDPNVLPADTSLRRAYIARIRAGQPTGWGYGVYIPGVTGESI